jgi:hypothetical protein
VWLYLFTHVSARKSDVTGNSELKKTSAKLRQLEDVNAKLKAKGFFSSKFSLLPSVLNFNKKISPLY